MTAQDEWRGDWETAEEQSLRAGLAATPEQRLEWLQAALEFAYAVGGRSVWSAEATPPLSDRTP